MSRIIIIIDLPQDSMAVSRVLNALGQEWGDVPIVAGVPLTVEESDSCIHIKARP